MGGDESIFVAAGAAVEMADEDDCMDDDEDAVEGFKELIDSAVLPISGLEDGGLL